MQPQTVVSGTDALSNMRRNPMSIWCGNEADSAGANQSYAGNRLKANFPSLRVTPKFELTAGSSVYAMGSCFAREIEAALGRQNFNVRSFRHEDFPPELFASPHVWGPSNFLNRYNTASMLLEVERLAGVRTIADTAMLYGASDKLVDLHFAASCEAGDQDLIRKRREVTKAVGSQIMDADVVIMTLGLTEAWFDKESGFYINSSPDLMTLRRDSDRFEMHNLDFAQNLTNLERIYEIITSQKSDRKFVITVSPVPLQATFNNVDIVIANFDSKMTLRAVAAEFCRRQPNVLYFPSFEMVFNSDPNHAWKGDRRHVTTAMVDHIMDTFSECHGISRHGDAAQLLTDLGDEAMLVIDSVPDGVEVVGDEIALHPFDTATGREATLAFRGLDISSYAGFSSGVSVINEKCEAVEFVLRLSRASGGPLLAEQAVRVEPGAHGDLSLDFPQDLSGAVDIALITRMVGESGSSAHAWSRFLSPKLQRKAMA